MIRKLPAQEKRVETGTLQFGDDWPGVFIRGDNASYFAILINRAAQNHPCVFEKVALESFARLLNGCVKRHE